MEKQIAGDLHVQTYMIVWDVNLNLTTKNASFDFITPEFYLNPTETKNKNWIRLYRYPENINISSNLSSINELRRCTIYMMDPSINTVTDVFKGFAEFPWKGNEWREKMRFVFELEMQHSTSADSPIIWKRCTTEVKSPVDTNVMSLNLDSKTETHIVLNNQGASCAVKRYLGENTTYEFDIIPENPAENWNLLSVMLRKKENNVWVWYYLHTTSTKGHYGRMYNAFEPLIILEIKELTTRLENMSEDEISAI